ncbi:DUF1697 domain-containing protein [uncultured Methanospirillum sp.]|uniref:DUF1697 domain-containing protein n=1 Tax=uncultured Methanospirillum sp. TaxID=262503 RepID=UPI0029C9816F|nr:DUF1697 domain-containing protein [uncultured Methanospirillum sp.]
MEHMNTYIVFLRGLNVGGNTMVSMKELVRHIEELGCQDVRTYLNSGNIILKTPYSEEELRGTIENELERTYGKVITTIIRSPKELEEITRNNPFPDLPGSQIGVLLTSASVNPDVAGEFVTSGTEQIRPGTREVYIYYPDGMGRSKLKIPSSLQEGTVRNMNTLVKLENMVNPNSFSLVH